ncbi:uroporphyrinogen-III synthase [Endothiovibrio diazotrophicus]
MSPRSLLGLGILVTRPEGQADPFCRLITEEGGTAFRFPVLEIGPPADPAPLERLIADLDRFDLVIFVSINAVEWGVEAVRRRRRFPPELQRAVIGPTTARALAERHLAPHLMPAPPYNSESLLALPEMHEVAGKRIVIFRGEGGREHIAETLRSRGAEVDYAEAYRRIRPNHDPAPLLRAWREGEIQVATATSNEALLNLVEMVGEEGRRYLLETPLVVISERNAALARELGFTFEPIVAQEAGDDAMVAAIAEGVRRQWTIR